MSMTALEVLRDLEWCGTATGVTTRGGGSGPVCPACPRCAGVMDNVGPTSDQPGGYGITLDLAEYFPECRIGHAPGCALKGCIDRGGRR